MKKHVLIIFTCINLCPALWAQHIPVSPPLPDTTITTSSAPVAQPSLGKRSLFYVRAGVSLFFPYTPRQNHTLYAPGVTVAPGIRLLQNRDAALTLSFPITVGWLRNNVFFDVDFPAMVDLNIGSAAGNNQNSSVGFVVGAGVAYLYAENSGERSIDIGGIRCQAGISFGKKNSDARNLILISYGESTAPGRNEVIGISFQFIMMNQ
ncbi:hypothetical protein [Chryseolinea soli]|uniref:Outer membrane protein beta-barrel domain-containing protein n=1 Tax=Chryseolinea soli TaxID=2321403 RepID=A0A385SPK5_9BACT|nr:hypothetical protein [Chryseolinea soli]AYB32211.1 hypothetical protein D4L85_17245 [Chryseolinea soli]